jgi:hypothetical protein
VRFCFVIVQREIEEIIQGKFFSSVKTFICIKDKQSGMVFPHPITNFIKNGFDRKSTALNTEKSVGEEIKKFLDYVQECIKEEDEMFLPLEEKGLKGLGLIHGANYLSYLTHRARLGEIKGNYVYRIELFLIKFYRWLSDQKIIEEEVQIEHITKHIRGETITNLISPFNNDELGTEYPKRENTKDNRLHDFGIGRLDLVNLFIRVAELEAPDIALGIAFQCYAGLRRSEVVNLLRSNVKKPNHSGTGAFTLNVSDNWKELFPNKKITVSEQVKNPRTQAVFKVPIVLEMYDKHMDNLGRLEKKGKLKNQNALFCSFFTGQPISGTSYWERFNKIKEKFLEIVLENDIEDYKFLTSKPWSTHIGRGIYTNMIHFLLNWSDSELAIARGDKSIYSAQAYKEEQNIIQKTNEAVELLAIASNQYEKEKYRTVEDLRRI